MAKQNFLAGGYYGKLGQTVGQRWKNIRTIRSYVIPRNPRTEAQQKNRGRFGDCVFFAQVANQLNYKAPCFNSASMTDWNYRMRTARGLQDLGLEELERFPLYPIDFSVPYTITEATITKQIDATHIEVDVSGTLPEAERVLTLVLLSAGDSDWKERLSVCVGYNSSENFNKFTFQLPDSLVLADGLQGRFVSCDDTDSSTDLIASSQMEIKVETKDIHDFDTTITSAVRSGNNFTLTFAEPFNNGTNTVSVSNVKAVVNGAWANVANPSASLINDNGFFALHMECSATDNQDLWAFPSGAEITISSISSVSATVEATAQNATEAFSNADLARSYKNTVSSVSRSNTAFTVAFGRDFPTVGTKSGNLKLQCVSKGAVVTPEISSFTVSASSIAFTQTVTETESIYAFPSGSTVTANIEIVSNGVTYSPETATAQSVANTADLVRAISTAPTFEYDLNSYYLRWALDGAVTVSTATVSGNRTFSKNLMLNSESGNFNVAVVNSTAFQVNLCSITAGRILAFVGSKLQTNTVISVVAGGVTYQVSAGQFAYDTSDFEGIAYCNDTVTVSDNNMDFACSGGTQLAQQPTSGSVVSTGYVGLVTSAGAWNVRASIQSFNTVYCDTSYTEIGIITSDFQRLQSGTDANYYPNPIRFSVSQGGKTFRFGLYYDGAEIDDQISED